MTVIDAVIVFVVVGSVGAGTLFIMRWLLRAAVGDLLDKLDGRIEGHMTSMRQDIAAIRAELSFNGGSTVKDQVKKIADKYLEETES